MKNNLLIDKEYAKAIANEILRIEITLFGIFLFWIFIMVVLLVKTFIF